MCLLCFILGVIITKVVLRWRRNFEGEQEVQMRRDASGKHKGTIEYWAADKDGSMIRWYTKVQDTESNKLLARKPNVKNENDDRNDDSPRYV